MTIEARIRRLFEDYDDAKCALENEYDARKEQLKANKAGEIYAAEVLELNMWFTEKENALLNLFTEQALKIQKEN